MDEEDTGFGLIPDPMSVNTESGKPTAATTRIKEDTYEAERENEWTLLDEAVTTGNTLYDVAVGTAIDLGSSPEDGFDANNVPGLFDNIPPEFHKELARSDSTIEAYAKKARIDDYLQNLDKLSASGWSGTGAMVAAGLIDADALLIPVTGGSYLGAKATTQLAKVGLKEGRLAGAIRGAGAGIEAGAVTSISGAAFGNTSDAGDIPASILMGMGFGTTIGAVVTPGSISPYQQMQAAQRAHAQYVAAKERGFTPDPEKRMAPSGSVGAAQVMRATPPPNLRKSAVPWFDRGASDINAMNAREVIKGDMDAETTNVDNVIGRGAQKVQNWVDKSPIKSLYTEVSNMGVIGNKLAYDLLYHPSGMLDGTSNPAAGYDAMYTQQMSIPIQNYHGLAMDFMGRPKATMKDRVQNAFIGKKQFRDFDRAVRMELETRYHTGQGDPNSHRAVKEFADQLDDMHRIAVEIQQGRAGEIAVAGSENLQAKSGYYSRRWNGEAIRALEAQHGPRVIEDALVDGYKAVLPNAAGVNDDMIRKIVKSIVTRSKALDEGIDTNLIGLLRAEGKEFLRDTLKNNSISDDEIDSIMSALTGNAAERAKPGFLKDRIELDMRTPIKGTQSTLLDLLEPDMYKSIHYYTRKVAGTSAMARKGYQLGDKTEIIESIKDELVQNGYDVNDPRVQDILETVFSYFGAGAIGGGIDPMLLSAMRLTRQSLLGTLGLTQLSELGNVVSMVGVEAAMKVMPEELRALTTGKKTPLVQEMHDAFIFLDKDHVLYDDELALDLVGNSSIVQTQFADNAHKVIAYGDKLSGYTSLFYQAMTFSQRVALAGVNHKLYKTLEGMDLSSGVSRRLLDLGMTEDLANALQKYINKKVVKLDKDGNLTMGFDKWDSTDLQQYKLAMNMFVARVVQKHLPGENPYWATKQFGQAVTQLRMFPIMAAQKQFLRNMRHADKTTIGALTWNLGVAGIIYSVSETVKGRGDNLTPEKIAKGAINYAPTSGWMPMITDPLAEIMGMPELRMNKYGPPGRATDGIIPTPPMIPTLNRMAHLPGAALGVFDGVDRNEASALSSLPIVGNTYGFSALFNYMKEH